MRLTIIVILLVICSGFGKKRFTIGVQNFADYRPYSQYMGGEYTGFNRDLLDMFAKSEGYTFVYKVRPSARMVLEFLSGELDMIYPSNPYWEKELKNGYDILYSDPVVEFVDGVVVHVDNKEYPLDSLHVLGTIIGFTPFAYLDMIEQGTIRLTENNNSESLLKQVLMRRVDGVYMNISVSTYLINEFPDGKDSLVFNSSLPYTRSYRSVATINYPEVIVDFNEFLRKNSVVIDSLKAAYNVEAGIHHLKKWGNTEEQSQK